MSKFQVILVPGLTIRLVAARCEVTQALVRNGSVDTCRTVA